MFDKKKKLTPKAQFIIGAVVCLTLLLVFYYSRSSPTLPVKPLNLEKTANHPIATKSKKEGKAPKLKKKPIVKPPLPPSSYHASKSMIQWHIDHCRMLKGKKFCDPYFIIIGAPKCGTTSLYYYFLRHPNIFKPRKKELRFFNFHNYSLEYIKNFEVPSKINMRKDLITLEASTNYILNSHTSSVSVYERIAKGIPDVKLVALLRNPVDRFMSHYNYRLMFIKLPPVQKKIQEDIEQLQQCYSKKKDRSACHLTNKEYNFDENLVVKSIYIDKFRGLLKHFPKEQLRVHISENLFADSTSVLKDLHDFLDIPYLESIDFDKVLPKIETRTRSEKNITKFSLTPHQRTFLCNFYRPFNEELVTLLGFKQYPWDC